MQLFRIFLWAKHCLRTGIISGILVFTLLSSIFVISGTAHAVADTSMHCQQYTIRVHLSPLGLITYHVASWLCYPQQPGNAVQLLVHGATYSHVYWDFSCPICNQDNYSYVQYMAQAGSTTFNYDRIGAGASDHPDPELVTIQSDAYVLSQLIGDLKTGSYGGPAFQKVIVVGHSLGSAIGVEEASDSTLISPSGLILSGFIHFVDPTELAIVGTEIHPADLDPDPRLNTLPPGYLTTIPNARAQLFYYLPNTDPNVISTDEATKDTITDSEFATFFTVEGSTISQQIHVPVLEALGQFDNLFCLGTFDCTNGSNVQDYEAPFFSPAAQLQVVIIPQAGHDLNLEENATTAWYPQALQWIQAHV